MGKSNTDNQRSSLNSYLTAGFGAIFSRFLGISIAGKLLLSYFSLLLLLFAISIYAFANLNKLNQVNSSILSANVPVINATETLIDLILSQEQYARRNIILKDPDLMTIFWEKDHEVHQLVHSINESHLGKIGDITAFKRLHQQYNELLTKTLSAAAGKPGNSKDVIRQIKDVQNKLITLTKIFSVSARRDLERKTDASSKIGLSALKSSVILFALGFCLSIFLTVIIARNIVGAIKKLNKATEMLSLGKYDELPDIPNRDELGELSKAFHRMSQRLKELEQQNLHTSPLTGLLGGVAIEQELVNRIGNENQIAFCMIDIDNFKAYNDRYGYAKGNRVIKKTAEILVASVSACGQKKDFIGHIGGDDFVIITTPEHHEKIAKEIVARFGKAIPDFYSAQDIKRGYIKATTRQGAAINLPLASITIAIVTNRERTVDNYVKFGEIAAELKEYAKSMDGSNYIIDRRKDDRAKLVIDNVIKPKRMQRKVSSG
jgi:diguanylate cyclase (GGDEF)-like protein